MKNSPLKWLQTLFYNTYILLKGPGFTKRINKHARKELLLTFTKADKTFEFYCEEYIYKTKYKRWWVMDKTIVVYHFSVHSDALSSGGEGMDCYLSIPCSYFLRGEIAKKYLVHLYIDVLYDKIKAAVKR